MLDDLRNSSSFLDDDDEPTNNEEEMIVERPSRRRQKESHFLGLTPQQRFIITLMIFAMVCVLGFFALYIVGAISLPF